MDHHDFDTRNETNDVFNECAFLDLNFSMEKLMEKSTLLLHRFKCSDIDTRLQKQQFWEFLDYKDSGAWIIIIDLSIEFSCTSECEDLKSDPAEKNTSAVAENYDFEKKDENKVDLEFQHILLSLLWGRNKKK